MFEKLRRPGRSHREGRVKKIFSYIVFGSICLVFVFLAPMSTQLIGEGVLGYVGKEPLRAREFKLIEDNLRRRSQKLLDQSDEETYLRIQKEIQQRALHQLAQMYLIVQGSQNSGFYLSDKELRDEIQSVSLFKKNGRFLYSLYLTFLKSQNLSSSRFEERIRKSKLAENWSKLFQKAVKRNKLEKNKSKEKSTYKLRLRYAKVPAEKGAGLAGLMRENKLGELNRFLKKEKIKWEDTGLVSLFSNFKTSIIQDNEVMDALVYHLPSTGLIPKPIFSGEKIYVVDIKTFKQEKTQSRDKNNKNIMELLSRAQGDFGKRDRLWQAWIELQKQKIKIKLSNKI